jgi:hypothetical protein
MDRRGKLGLRHQGAQRTWGAPTKSGTVRGKLRHGRKPVRTGRPYSVDSAPTSCFLWGG